MPISLETIKAFREQTGAGITEAKKVLEEAGGDVERAIVLLRQRGKKMMESKAARQAREGALASYIHATGKVGAMVALVCETDFVARSDLFRKLAYNIAAHVAASDPRYIRREDVPSETLEQEQDIYRQQLKSDGKSEVMMEKIIPGKLEKFYQEVVLLDQAYIRDEEKSIANLLEEATQQLGERIEIQRFVRFTI